MQATSSSGVFKATKGTEDLDWMGVVPWGSLQLQVLAVSSPYLEGLGEFGQAGQGLETPGAVAGVELDGI